MELTISPALANLPRINSNDLEDLQGNLKDLTESNYKKLKTSLETEGFIFPLFVWQSPDTELMYSFDGHQRLRLIQRELPGGIDLPYVLVEAEDLKEAKKKLLLFNSQYGQVTKDGWDEFIADMTDTTFVNDMTTFGGYLDENWMQDGKTGDSDDLDGSSSSSSKDVGNADTQTYRIEAICASEWDQQQLFDELKERGYQCKVLTL